ncbi:hypothetical protein QJS10_CPB19g00894 [Acorus calamus]|uniref:Amidase domain-containing protein n=1 Tax=Acorus calamus TaxID=4465 RepID=A0AAV9CGH3_ACOCL|nr:hypothetical protein QJS10_CPB19g00894 [Acorus calamus]
MTSAATNLFVLLGLGLAGVLLMTRRLKKAVREDFGAFVERLQLLPPPPPPPPKAPHPLTGLTFAVSDIFDIDGYTTGFGHPDWARTHDIAYRTSAAVSALIEGGATCVGKTVIDELAYGINGENGLYGTPTNPAAPTRLPGGSSSGSAVAVAAQLVDFSLGTDTVGGVRVPGGYCSIYAFRPSHGVVSSMGVIPVSPSLDTIGWFAKDPSILRRVGHVLLQLPYANSGHPRHVIFADDCFQLSQVPVNRISQVVTRCTEKLFGRQVLNHIDIGEYFASKVPSLKQFQDKNQNGEMRSSSLVSLANAMRLLCRSEFKHNHKDWINSITPVLHPSISLHINSPSEEAEDANIEQCQIAKNEARLALNSLLKNDGILVLPTVAGPPPKLGSKEILSDDYQTRTYSLLAVAGLSGCCQVNVPLGLHEKCPVSVSLIARYGGDRFLLDTLCTMQSSIQDEVDIVEKFNFSSNTISQEESAEIAKGKGNAYFKDKQWQKAINCYSEAIKLNGKNATYYSNRAAAYLELGSFIQAESDCSNAINLDKKNIKAYLRRGTAREMLGFYKDAIEDFQYALVLEPTNTAANRAINRLKKLFA